MARSPRDACRYDRASKFYGLRLFMVQVLWLVIVCVLTFAAIGAANWLVYVVGGGIALAFLGWIVISVLWPSKPDRRCPHCGQEGLIKLRRGEPGVVCELCGFRDESMHVAYLDDW